MDALTLPKPALELASEIGALLFEIQRDRLYLETHHEFYEYCEHHFNLNKKLVGDAMKFHLEQN